MAKPKQKKTLKTAPARLEKRPLKDRQVRAKSTALKGKSVAVALCGGIAVVEVIKIIRELRRHGAEVTAFYTPDVLKFITPVPMEWATGRKVYLEPQANVEHLEVYDLVLVVPATLNTLSKSALGLADNVVTLLIASQLGKKDKVLFIPAMNGSLFRHPRWANYQAELEGWGAEFLINEEEEGRIKIPDPERVTESVIRVVKGK